MHALIVVAHPNPTSLSHSIAHAVASGLAERQHTAEIADLAAEGFDPRYLPADLALMHQPGPALPEIQAEQDRIDRADALVLVYPVYWWSFPALMKGWIDRVFTHGWAYDETRGGLLQRLPVHLFAIAASGQRTYDKHGYTAAMQAQIDHGIFGYCGAPVASSTVLHLADVETAQTHLDTARQQGREMFQGGALNQPKGECLSDASLGDAPA